MVIRTAQVVSDLQAIKLRPVIAVRPSCSPRFHLTDFDCVLPREVRAELLGRRKLTKPLITPARKPVRGRIVRIAGWLVLALLVALVLASNLHFYPDRPRPVEIKPAAPTITPTLPRTESTLASPALRAELVRLPAPRAE